MVSDSSNIYRLITVSDSLRNEGRGLSAACHYRSSSNEIEALGNKNAEEPIPVNQYIKRRVLDFINRQGL